MIFQNGNQVVAITNKSKCAIYFLLSNTSKDLDFFICEIVF